MTYSMFESALTVRPDDIDMNNHVHFSKYLDYVLAARYDQMKRCYGMAMEEFIARGFMWVVKSCQIDYKRPLGLGDSIIIRTGIDGLTITNAFVRFEILRSDNRKIVADGRFEYTLVRLDTGRAETIPEDVIKHYSV